MLTSLLEGGKEPVKELGAVVESKKKTASDFSPGLILCMKNGSPGARGTSGGEETDTKAAILTGRCISTLFFPIFLAYTSSHRQKEVIHSAALVVTITSSFILVCMPSTCMMRTPQ